MSFERILVFIFFLHCSHICNACSSQTSPITTKTTTASPFARYQSLYNELLPIDDCGNWKLAKRILGGKNTEMTEHLWMAGLLSNIKGTIKIICGGSIITKSYILTAAHCLDNSQPGFLIGVRIGEWQISTSPDCQTVHGEEKCNPKHKDFGVDKIFIHSHFKKRAVGRYDIGIIRLTESITFNDDQNNARYPLAVPVCLPQIGQNRENVDEETIFEVVGWGFNATRGYQHDIKQSLQIKGFNHTKCKDALETEMLDTVICAGGVKNEDTCNGDSGGPLLLLKNSEEIRYYLEGVTAAGGVCGREGQPAIYTRVSLFMEWILDTIQTKG